MNLVGEDASAFRKAELREAQSLAKLTIQSLAELGLPIVRFGQLALHRLVHGTKAL